MALLSRLFCLALGLAALILSALLASAREATELYVFASGSTAAFHGRQCRLAGRVTSTRRGHLLCDCSPCIAAPTK